MESPKVQKVSHWLSKWYKVGLVNPVFSMERNRVGPGVPKGSFNKNMLMLTPPKFNIAPENGWLEYYFPIGKVTFQGLC